MPELPEVETIRRGLANLRGRKIKNVFRSQKRLRIESNLDLFSLKNSKIKDFERKARYLIVHFDDERSLIVHLGMSGKLTHKNKYKNPAKHDHLICELEDESSLIFNDARRFGFVDLIETKNLAKHKMLAKLGPEPFDVDADYLHKKLQNKKMNIKTTMMDNEIVVGVGNIYINESLFESRISPLRESATLKKNEVEKLLKAIKKILQHAIESGGSSISDYVDSKGNQGNFQNNFKIYGREGKKCAVCDSIIKRIVQNGRSSFYCDNCQV